MIKSFDLDVIYVAGPGHAGPGMVANTYLEGTYTEHPHGMSDAEFDALFTTGRPVIFAYHGYPWLITG